MLPPSIATMPPFSTLKRCAARFSVIVTNPKQLSNILQGKRAGLPAVESEADQRGLCVQIWFTLMGEPALARPAGICLVCGDASFPPKETIMKIAGPMLLSALLLFSAAPAGAVVLDLSTMSCKQFLEGGDDTIKMVLTWMDGWYKGDSDEAIIDTDVFVENAKKFGAYCGKNPTVSIVNAAESVLGK